jgi:hypothetical protein
MNTNKYNGWTNYATWRINLELFDGYETEYPIEGHHLRDIAREYLECDNELTFDYAIAFLSDVNFREIAEAINETLND